MTTAFTELVGCTLPIQLAGMGGDLSDVALAAAVTNAGGLGMLGAAGVPGAALASRLAAMSDATDGPFGVNFLVPFIDPDSVRVAAPLCRVCDFHIGTPNAAYVETVHVGGALAGWQVGSLPEAIASVDAGCDFVIAQGNEAGGHMRRNSFPLDDLLAKLVGTIDVPIVAAGGIGTSERVRDLIDAGAAGVRIGTRFLAATESPAHPDYITALIASSADDTEVTEAFGADWPDVPHRVLSSSIQAATVSTDDVVATVGSGDEAWPVQRFSSIPPNKDAHGNIAAMALYAGTSVQHVSTRQPASEIVAELCSLL